MAGKSSTGVHGNRLMAKSFCTILTVDFPATELIRGYPAWLDIKLDLCGDADAGSAEAAIFKYFLMTQQDQI